MKRTLIMSSIVGIILAITAMKMSGTNATGPSDVLSFTNKVEVGTGAVLVAASPSKNEERPVKIEAKPHKRKVLKKKYKIQVGEIKIADNRNF